MCEGWSEYAFEFMPKDRVDIVVDPVKLHLSTDAVPFQGEMIGLDTDKSKIYNHRNVSSKDPKD